MPPRIEEAKTEVVKPPAVVETKKELPEPRVSHDGPPPAPERAVVIARLNQQLRDAYFDYDRAEIRPDAVAALEADAHLLAPILAEFPEVRVIVEGHCDERGSAEYNLGLGANRAARAAEVLKSFGLPPDRGETISYGKEAPQCQEASETCWRLNRRAHLMVR